MRSKSVSTERACSSEEELALWLVGISPLARALVRTIARRRQNTYYYCLNGCLMTLLCSYTLYRTCLLMYVCPSASSVTRIVVGVGVTSHMSDYKSPDTLRSASDL